MLNKVFISYSHIDSKIAHDLASVLTEIGVEYFFDIKDVNWGDAITARVRDSLNDCIAILVIISPASLKSHWVPYEIGYASALAKAILPFLTHVSLDVPHYIRDIAYATTIGQVRDYFVNTFPQLKISLDQDLIERGGDTSTRSILSQNEAEVLREAGRDEDGYVRPELMAKVMNLSESTIEGCLRELKKRGFLSELDGPWTGTYELSEEGHNYLKEKGLK